MHSTDLVLLLTTAIGFLPQTYAQASPEAKLTFCFNGGTTDADCITSSTTFDNACKRVSVPNAPGKTLTLSQVTVRLFSFSNTFPCSLSLLLPRDA